MGNRIIKSHLFFLTVSLVNDLWHVSTLFIIYCSDILEGSCKSQNLCLYVHMSYPYIYRDTIAELTPKLGANCL